MINTILIESTQIKNKFLYRNIPGVLKSGLVFDYTLDEISEITKCENDIIYFIENYCKIRDVNTGELMTIKLYDFQKEILDNLSSNRFNIILQSRQVGISMLHSLIILHKFLFSSEKNIVLIDKGNVLERVKDLYVALPYFLKVGITKWSKDMIWSNRFTRLRTRRTSENIAIGYQIHDLHATDLAYDKNSSVEQMFNSLYPTMSALKNSKILLTSASNGNTFFNKIFQDAEADKNNFNPIRVYWDQVPGRNEEWKKNEILKVGLNVFENEYEMKFKNKK